jgi:Zn-dependent peptidase ImmA (M78 family)
MAIRVAVKPELLRWARERAGLEPEELAQRFPRLREWEAERAQPTFKQLEQYARATHAPFGYFFLPEPPVEELPIPDFRTAAGRRVQRPSPNLLDTIFLCQQRQEWYREYAQLQGQEPLAFVGSANLPGDVAATAATMRGQLRFDVEERRGIPTWAEALRRFIEQADALGVLVMVNGVVANNNHRRLDPNEFRGFALADPLAPLIFINGADTKAAQIFTLAHELAHVWLGQSALSDVEPIAAPTQAVEAWCNRVAAELLVPLALIRQEYRRGEDLRGAIERLARYFKVSTLVVLRRIHDAGGITRERLREAYAAELERLQRVPRGSGGNFYLTQGARIGKRFARALVTSTLEGQTLYRDAFHLLGFSKVATFNELGHSLGIV